ncbi:MAG TPA: hypothetical protein DCL69_09145 [Firmicutes bacterium]|nr:hypothetical protein [Bacillota bacterium]
MPAYDNDHDQLRQSLVLPRRTAVMAAALILLMLLGLSSLIWQPSGAAEAAGSAPRTAPRTIDALVWMPDSNSLLFISDTDLYGIAANGKGLRYICSGIDFVLPGPAGQLLAGDGQSLLGLSLLTGATFPVSEKAPAAVNMPDAEGLRRASWSLLSNTAYYGSADGDIMAYEAPTGKLTPLEKGLDPQVSLTAGTLRAERLVFWTAAPNEAGQIRIRDLHSASARSFAPALPPGRSPVWLAQNEIAYIAAVKGNNQLALAKVSPQTSAVGANATGATNAALIYQSAFAFQTIQIAAYTDPEEAAAFISVCQPLCDPYQIYVVAAEVNHTKWYRIRVGIFKNKTDLNSALDRILPALKTAAAWDGKHFIATAANHFGWLCPSPDGSFLIFSLMNAIYRYNNRDQKLVCLYKPAIYAPENKTNAILSPDGEKVAFLDESGRLRVMSAQGDQLITILNR